WGRPKNRRGQEARLAHRRPGIMKRRSLQRVGSAQKPQRSGGAACPPQVWYHETPKPAQRTKRTVAFLSAAAAGKDKWDRERKKEYEACRL
ncbi:hypothetical protein, partial [Neglectibacter timonensis]|uniref:hypothetical protein n=1 Tax=Neglectibacter timonensis TaxID=1776382 RepID=UPI0039969CF9